MIYDCFTLFNEIDLLEARIKINWDYVDYFVIAEANKTHTYNDKPYNFLENSKRFEPYFSKIIYKKIDLTDSLFKQSKFDTRYNPQSNYWKLENRQRDSLLKNIKFNDNDIIIISDLDEIPDLSILDISKIIQPISLKMKMFYYSITNCSVTDWIGSVICSYRVINNWFKNSAQLLRNNRFNLIPVENGWHWSYLGNAEFIQNKIKNFAHTEYNNDNFTKLEDIQKHIDNNEDLFGRGFKYIKIDPVKFYPERILKIMDKFLV